MDRTATPAGPPAGRARTPAVLAGLLLAPAAALTTPAALATSIPSRLPWRSGSTTGGFSCLAQLRGRPLDVATTFVPSDRGFAGITAFTAGSYWRAKARLAPLLVVSLP